MKVSVVVVCLNAGEELSATVQSVLMQNYEDFEIIIKDGGSRDGSLEKLPGDERIKVYREEDQSIYDAMNQAIRYTTGDYLLFLNCGDYLADAKVLGRIVKVICKTGADIVYGDLRRRGQNAVIVSPEAITDFVCYRNIPCHQVCFYHKRLFAERGYDLAYPVRADYEHFLWCKYEKKASFAHGDFVVAEYEGEGYSETKENLKKAAGEHRRITGKYLGKKCILYRGIMIVTLQPIRKKMAESRLFSGLYQGLKKKIYGAGKKKG